MDTSSHDSPKLRCVLVDAVDSQLPRLCDEWVEVGPVGLDTSRDAAHDVPGDGRVIKVPLPTRMTMHQKEFSRERGVTLFRMGIAPLFGFFIAQRDPGPVAKNEHSAYYSDKT